MSDKQTRKAGDALILSGGLSVSGLPDDLDWTGALGELHIVTDPDGTLERSDAATITPPAGTAPGRYSYVGSPIVEGKYLYELQITFPGLADPLTFPNNRSKFKLIVEPQLA